MCNTKERQIFLPTHTIIILTTLYVEISLKMYRVVIT